MSTACSCGATISCSMAMPRDVQGDNLRCLARLAKEVVMSSSSGQQRIERRFEKEHEKLSRNIEESDNRAANKGKKAEDRGMKGEGCEVSEEGVVKRVCPAQCTEASAAPLPHGTLGQGVEQFSARVSATEVRVRRRCLQA